MMPAVQNQREVIRFNIPVWKRVFDLILASLAIFFLMPVFLIIGLLIKLDSKGSIFYISKRVGAGYKVFDFYKFRTMRTGADKELEKLKKDLNQYQNDATNDQDNSVFVKLKKDPRITRLGKFLRNTSLDELPQLLNIIKGDMSIVGNRPLPVYEAEQLMRDYNSSKRFLAPAGLTGLWQVKKRGQKEMSAEERKHLDNEYAKNYSFWMDLKLIIQTFGVFIQKENV